MGITSENDASVNQKVGTTFYQLLMAAAREAAFPLAGALDLDLAGEAFKDHVSRYDRWLAAGHAGAMDYLVRGRDRRADPRQVFSAARSLLAVGQPYDARPLGSASFSQGPRYARYLRSRDYHKQIAERLDAMMSALSAKWQAMGNPPLQWKTCVDTSAVLERTWAALAGLGWIGKNTLLIHPKLGSYFFLGEVLIDQETGMGPAPIPDLCGHCVRCQRSCPTDAFPEPHTLDSNRCISYRTLEKKGALNLDPDARSRMGAWIAGCDLCQEVCPFNWKTAREAGATHAPEDASYLAGWLELLAETEPEYRARVRDSALSRVKSRQFSRNLALAFGNALEQMTDKEREAISESAGALINRRLSLESETDPETRELWMACIQSAKRNP